MTILIPAYEPTVKMLDLIREIADRTLYTIIVVDDGSGPGYGGLFEEARRMGCIVLKHDANRGKGAALKTGFQYLMQIDFREGVVCADSDGQHQVDDIIRVARAVRPLKRGIVLGVRTFKGNIPLRSRFGNGVTARLFQLATGIRLSDTQTGLRGYPAALLPWLCGIGGERFEYEFDMLLKAKDAGVTLTSLPIMTIYESGNKSSHFRPLVDSFKVYLPLLKFGASSMTAGVLDFILLFVFQAMTGSLFFGVAFARAISSIFNYSVNNAIVFKGNGEKRQRSAGKYFALVAVIMLLNYLLLLVMTQVIGMPDIVAKLMTECLLFAMSYGIQKKFVFRKKGVYRHA